MNDIIDPLKDYSYEVDISLKEWDKIHENCKRGYQTIVLDGVNHIYLICHSHRKILISDTFGEEI